MKGLTSQQLEDLDCHVILGNTYHLETRPGADHVAALGGLHGFVGWPRGMLTDSGGFQVQQAHLFLLQSRLHPQVLPCRE